MRRPVERLEKKVDRENLWLYILHILSKKERYAFEIRGLVEKQFGFLAGTVTAYKVLYLLKNGGYVSTEEKDGRKYYNITPKGREQLSAARAFFIRRMKSFNWL